MSVTTVFRCKLCGAAHEAVNAPEPLCRGCAEDRRGPDGNAPHTCDRQAARLAWEKACTRLDGDPGAQGILERATTAKLEAAELRTSLAYFGTMSNGVPRLPETITTARGTDGAYYLCCVTCPQV